MDEASRVNRVLSVAIDEESKSAWVVASVLMSLIELLRTNQNPDREAILDAIGGNLCRCTGYQQIVDAIALAARRLAEGAR